MKIVEVTTLIAAGDFACSKEWKRTRRRLHEAITAVDWPPGSGAFTIYPESGKKRGKGNGVVPIKRGLMRRLHAEDWKLEEALKIVDGEGVKANGRGGRSEVVSRPGKLDAVLYTKKGPVALEWETGNISSSHRALNKMALGLLKGILVCGILVVPSRGLYRYLTDRIGNIVELRPYFDLWRSIPCKAGVLEIVVIEQDATSTKVPRIPKGTDGRAKG